MKGLENPDALRTNRAPTCSFCSDPSHRIGDCPHVNKVWTSLTLCEIPVDTLRDTHGLRWMVRGDNWGKLYTHTERSWNKWKKAQERRNKPKSTKSRRAPRCGFCGSVSHTRRTCDEQTKWAQRLVTANRNFRRIFYDKYVSEMGISTGCIVKIETSPRYGQTEGVQFSTVVTNVDWDTVNLFCTLRGVQGWNMDARAASAQDFVRSALDLKFVKPPSVGKMNELHYNWEGVPNGFFKPLYTFLSRHNGDSGALIIPEGGREWQSVRVKEWSIISRAPEVLPEDWVDGYGEEMAVVFKKYSRRALTLAGILDHIDAWAEATENNHPPISPYDE